MSTDEPLKTELRIDPSIRAVEVKITARIGDEGTVLALLEGTGEEPEKRTVYFFDTPELDLFDAGIVLRARKLRGEDDDTTVKLRPVDPALIPIDWMTTEGFEIELDKVGDSQVISAKLGASQEEGEIDAVVKGQRPLRKLFSSDQERLLEAFGPREVGWDDLVIMGPIDVRKWKVEFDGFAHEVTAERWILPDRSDLIELSIKVEPGEAGPAADAFTAFLEGRGLDVGGDQHTKARGALLFFTAGVGFA